jgi:hypothetical protein
VKRILISLCLCVSIVACAPSPALPTITPTVTPAQTVAPTATETLIPLPTVEITPSPVATPTEDPNKLTYKNADQVEVTVELTIHEHVNPDGSKEEWIEVPNTFALFKYMADHMKWYPAGTDYIALGALVNDGPNGIRETYPKWGVGYPPPRESKPSTMPYPSASSAAAMHLTVLGVDGGTVIWGEMPEGNYGYVFLKVDPYEVSHTMIDGTPDFDTLDYLNKLAAQHANQ